MLDGEPLLNAPAPAVSQTCRQIRLHQQTCHRPRHAGFVTFLHQQPCLSLQHHLRDTGMTGCHHRQTTELGFHHRHRIALAVTIRGHHRVLHEPPHLTHQLRHPVLGTHAQKSDLLLEAKLHHQRPCRGQQRALSHHPQLGLQPGHSGITAEQSKGSQRLQRTLLGHKTPHRQQHRWRRGRVAALKQSGIGAGGTDQQAIRWCTQRQQGVGHRSGFNDHAGGHGQQTPVTPLQQTQATLSRGIGTAEMHHQGHAGPGAGLHHPHRFKTELHHHHIRLMATDQGQGHAGCRQPCQTQPMQTREQLAEQDRTAVGQSPGVLQRPFVAEVGRQGQRQPTEIGANEGFTGGAGCGGQHQHPLTAVAASGGNPTHGCAGRASTERQWGSTTSQSSERRVVRAAAP